MSKEGCRYGECRDAKPAHVRVELVGGDVFVSRLEIIVDRLEKLLSTITEVVNDESARKAD